MLFEQHSEYNWTREGFTMKLLGIAMELLFFLDLLGTIYFGPFNFWCPWLLECRWTEVTLGGQILRKNYVFVDIGQNLNSLLENVTKK